MSSSYSLFSTFKCRTLPDRTVKSVILPPRTTLTTEFPPHAKDPFSTIISEEHAAEISAWIDRKTSNYATTNIPYDLHLNTHNISNNIPKNNKKSKKNSKNNEKTKNNNNIISGTNDNNNQTSNSNININNNTIDVEKENNNFKFMRIATQNIRGIMNSINLYQTNTKLFWDKSSPQMSPDFLKDDTKSVTPNKNEHVLTTYDHDDQ
ncbi:hypothetical protein Glove_151g33 [Diversispora epigaea]|uniref:Uncharacterized protein n=1 Tax=Diversispora epigaea TaxID=1348612 RepID=A0A397ISY4_9GLOM|nr:hypothetical protein Glove_151g33 [Diversispora epigaea]